MSRWLGPERQNGSLVRDVEAAMRHGTEALGSGPWFEFERLPVEAFRYGGEPSPLDVSIALACSGGLQNEQIQPRNDAPSAKLDARGWDGAEPIRRLGER